MGQFASWSDCVDTDVALARRLNNETGSRGIPNTKPTNLNLFRSAVDSVRSARYASSARHHPLPALRMKRCWTAEGPRKTLAWMTTIAGFQFTQLTSTTRKT